MARNVSHQAQILKSSRPAIRRAAFLFPMTDLILTDVVSWRRALHAMPELRMDTPKTEAYIAGELAKLAEAELGWKRTTSYTVLGRLCQRGLFKNEGGVVQSLVSREDFYSMQSENFVEESFEGSLPAFVAAFSRRKKLSGEEIEELKRLIDGMRGE